MQLLDMKIA